MLEFTPLCQSDFHLLNKMPQAQPHHDSSLLMNPQCSCILTAQEAFASEQSAPLPAPRTKALRILARVY